MNTLDIQLDKKLDFEATEHIDFLINHADDATLFAIGDVPVPADSALMMVVYQYINNSKYEDWNPTSSEMNTLYNSIIRQSAVCSAEAFTLLVEDGKAHNLFVEAVKELESLQEIEECA